MKFTTPSDETKAPESAAATGELKPTPADEWPTNEPQLVKLPSGAVALLHRPQFFMLRQTGQIPRRVIAIVDKRDRHGETISEGEALTVLNYSVCAAFVDPPASLTKRKGCVHVPSMTEADRISVLQFIHGGM
jgi:hypothetical protein